MRYWEVAGIPASGRDYGVQHIMQKVREAHRAQIWPEIANPTDEQRAAMLHEIECPGLTVHQLEADFAEAYQRRRLWCRANCESGFTVEPMMDRERCIDVGRRFCFADQAEAVRFRQAWG